MTMVANTQHKPWLSPKIWGLAAATILVFAYAQYNSIESLIERWANTPEFSHGFFIPLVSLWLAWERREAVFSQPLRSSYFGIVIVVAACVVLLIGETTDTAVFNHISFIIGVVGLVYVIGGWRLTRIMAIPLFFLVFMVPWPYVVTSTITAQLQLISSQLGVEFIRVCNIPVYLEGNVIDLGFYRLGVVEACSGLSYLVPLLGLGFMAAYFCRGPLWHKILVMAAVVPLTIIMNSFRIAMIGVIAQFFGIEYAEGFLHYFEGWAVFVMCIGVIYLLMVALAIISKMKTPFSPMHLPDFVVKSAPDRSGSAGWSLAPLATSVVAILATIFLVGVANARLLELPERSQLIGLPYDIASSKVKILPLERAVEDILGADDYVVANLNSETPDAANLYVAYLDSQRDDRSWHSPKQCIPGGGWRIVTHETRETELPDGLFKFNRLVIQKHEASQLVYYWYQQRGRSMASEWAVKAYLVYDAIVAGRTDGAMVRLTTHMLPNESPETADKRLMSYVGKVKAALPKYVPN